MKNTLLSIRNYLSRFLLWLLTAAFIGCLCGLAGGLFAMAVEWATHTRGATGLCTRYQWTADLTY